MATGGNYERTVVGSADEDNEHQQNASAEADDSIIIKYTCNPCKESNTVKEALHYCPECEEFYCGGCVRFHNIMAKLKNHILYGKSDEHKWGHKTTTNQLSEKCTKHPTETISMICEACNELCCHVCISLKHSNCHSKEYIPTAAQGVRTSTKLASIKRRLKKSRDKADQYKSRNENSVQDLNLKQATFLQHIADMRKEVNDVFDEMEERATLGVTHFGNTLHVNLKEEIETCDALSHEMSSLADKLENVDSGDKNDCQIFMDLVKSENSVEKAEREMYKLQASNRHSEVVDGLHFASNTNMHQLLQEIKSFGQVSCRYMVGSGHDDCPHDDTHLDAYVEGICQLYDGTFILTDSAKFCLTRLSSTYMVKEKVHLDVAPSSVCNMEPKHVAVCLDKKLKVFLVDKQIAPDIQYPDLHFNHQCHGIAYHEKKYYISDSNSIVYVYDIYGRCKKKIETNQRLNIFQSVRNIAIGQKERKIYVTDIEKGLITLDLNGKVISTLEIKDTKGVYGVCVTSDGRVLVSNYLLDSIIEVDKEGKNILQRNLISLSEGQSPRSICYDSQNSCVLVSENNLGGSAFLSVYQI